MLCFSGLSCHLWHWHPISERWLQLQLPFWSSFLLMHLGKTAKDWFVHTWETWMEVPGSWFNPGPFPAIVVISGLNSLCLCVCVFKNTGKENEFEDRKWETEIKKAPIHWFSSLIPGARRPLWVFHVGIRDPVTWTINSAYQFVQEQEVEQGLQPRVLQWGMQVGQLLRQIPFLF